MRYVIAAILLCAAPASAQTAGSESVSGSQSYSGVNVEASRSIHHAPGMGAPSAIPTADCINGHSGAVSGPGFGLAIGTGNGSWACNTRANAAMLAALGGEQVAIDYVCSRDEGMRNVLQARGLCGSVAAPGSTETAATSERCPAGSTWDGRGCWASDLRRVNR